MAWRALAGTLQRGAPEGEIAETVSQLAQSLPISLAETLWLLEEEVGYVTDKATSLKGRQRGHLPFPMGAVGFAQKQSYFRTLSPTTRGQALSGLHLFLGVLNEHYCGHRGL